ncbi:MAG: M56 family metallopeptidase [Bacillota bacterium]|nr:M56 family metallopeptidase [Bacillota bacterium]
MHSLIFATILTMSVTGGIIILLISMLRPVTARAFSAAWNYYVNLIVLIFLLISIGFIPGKVFVDIPPGFVVQVTETDSIAWDDMQEVIAITGNELIHADQRTKFAFHLDDILSYLFWIWLLGMLICISHKGKQFLKFKRNLLKTSLPVEKGSCAYQVYQECRSTLRMRQKISLLCNDSIKTPMVTGLFNCCLIIPQVDMDKSELGFILRHELIHCKRKDLWFKAVAWFANAVHWFNPWYTKWLAILMNSVKYRVMKQSSKI